MDEIKQQLEIVREALADYDAGKLSDLSALIAIQISVTAQRCSKEAFDWARNAVREKLK